MSKYDKTFQDLNKVKEPTTIRLVLYGITVFAVCYSLIFIAMTIL